MEWFEGAAHFLVSMGMTGIFILSILDSTVFFFTPFAIDFLFIFLVARHHAWMPYYVLLVAVGSVLGCALTYVVVVRAGETTLASHFPLEKIEQVQKKLKKKGFVAIVVAALLPPPLPFSPFIAAAAVARLELKRLLGAVSVGRVLRFLIEGVLTLIFGRHLLKLLHADAFKVAMIVLFLLAIAGSAFSIWKWCRKPAGAGA